MTNTSVTGGYLSPIGTQPDYDKDLSHVLQEAIAGITGISGDLVRRKYQPTTPKMPEPKVDWVSFYIHTTTPDDSPAITHKDSVGGGYDENVRHEELNVLCTFHGTNAESYASRLRDGLGIPQNMAALKTKQISFIDAGQVTAVPEFINQVWVRRFDVLVTFRRKTLRSYAVLNVLGANTPQITTDR